MMEMRGGFMRPPRERGGLMRPLGPLRGRGVMGMERMRLGPPLRPGLMRGGPPVPFVGRGMVLPHHARPRAMGPVMLPRPHIPPPGPMGPLGPRGMLPRAMLPPRPLGPDIANLNDLPINSQLAVNGAMKGVNNQLKLVKESGIPSKSAPVAGQNQQLVSRVVNRNIKLTNRVNKGNQNAGQVGGLKKNRKDIKNRRQGNLSEPLQQLQTHQQMQISTQPSHQAPVRDIVHPSQHHAQLPLPQQNSLSQVPKHVHPIPPQMSTGVVPQSQSHPIQHQPSVRNGMNPRNRNPAGTNRTGLINTIQSGPGNRGNMYVNRGAPSLASRPVTVPMSNRGNNSMLSGPPPPSALYSQTPPASYAVPPPVVAPQMSIKRGGPPMNPPPVMQPKRVRYDTPLPSNGYAQYHHPHPHPHHHQQQQQPPPPLPQQQQQPVYSYDVPPPVEVYNNAPPPALNMQPSPSYNTADYNNYSSVPQNNAPYSSAPAYSPYNNAPTYSSYSTTTGYDSSSEYMVNSQPTNSGVADPYGYTKTAPPIDAYGYSNQSYSNPQTTYEDYNNSGYMEVGGYAAPVQAG